MKSHEIMSRVYGFVTSNNGFWIGWWDLLTPYCTITLLITVNFNSSQSIFNRTLLPLLPRTRSFLVVVLRVTLIYDWTIYIVSRRIHRKHIRCLAMDICEPHRKHHFFYCIYSTLHSNGSYAIVACVFVVAGMCLPSRCPAMGLHVRINWTLKTRPFSKTLPFLTRSSAPQATDS
jgi:hypothetical protein